MSLYTDLYNQRNAIVVFVDTVDGADYVAFAGGTMLSIFEITDDGLALFDEFNHDDAESRGYILARKHIEEQNEERFG